MSVKYEVSWFEIHETQWDLSQVKPELTQINNSRQVGRLKPGNGHIQTFQHVRIQSLRNESFQIDGPSQQL